MPAVLAHDGGTIVLAYLDGPPGDRRALGRRLATVHRLPLLQLPPLLVHVRLVGASYLTGVAARLDALGW